MDCEGCERKVRRAVEGMKGVTQVEVNPKQSKLTVSGYVEVNPKQSKLTVSGYVEANKVLKRVRRKTGKHAEIWPYVPYDVVYHPYAAGAYDKKAPPGYVRNVMEDPAKANLARASSMEEKYSTAFSDENPNACTIM
ncbi:hypothetical protein J5N97_016183 [Dioscorea zingiberensis]|uniref:HMA domain-containing protein n=1 Tax=Dioscorea zingiberensis TaxID=325984 RepID=A0A9D5CIX1_9LILI|nr:hypothetical protein J5N97_016183 [Dioscorea zingiberensis]